MGVDKEKLIGKYFKDLDPLKILSEKVAESIKNTAEDFDLIVYDNKHFEVFILPFKTSGDTDLMRIIFKDITNFVTLEKELLKRTGKSRNTIKSGLAKLKYWGMAQPIGNRFWLRVEAYLD